ncbi:flavohemoprotein [Paenibacillus sp. J31TS4]|uniref:NO-inducible flavohemoprotein n=1 Tax=Paenibacillus sp. J31TS4 TaxID=2807195 RepID=UPI001B016736|nr:NO-inducible flavohemoprotein [Paenibacillus sp. J31TS4]GIP37541.1 flavohemoprotein [Paenibacillus sp. J31TS4]
MLQPSTIETIKATVPVLQAQGRQITTRFYQLLFEKHPELLNVFNHTNQREGRQQAALAGAVYAAAAHIDRLEAILPAARLIAQKHRSLGIKPEHYPIVGENLLLAIQDVLGLPADHEVIRAWGEAYGMIAQVFIDLEAEMYREAAEQPGGWDGFREFRIARKVKESDVITSFYLEPADGGALAGFVPGQYITVKAVIPGETNTHLRQYSLSDRPGTGYYRITVKREAHMDGRPAGKVSTWLHDHVQAGDSLPLSAPAGEFVLDAQANRSVVLLSAGVGLTPMLSMLASLRDSGTDRPVFFLHGARNGSVHALGDSVKELTAGLPNFRAYVTYSEPAQDDLMQGRCDGTGRLDLTRLPFALPDAEVDYYLCGPAGFLADSYAALRKLGIADSLIHYEAFGPEPGLRQAYGEEALTAAR